MLTDWEWDEFNKQVEKEIDKVKKRSNITMLRSIQIPIIIDNLINNGVLISRQGNEVEAVANYTVAAEIDPTCWKAFYNLGWQYLTIGKRLHQPFMGGISFMKGDSDLYKSYEKSLERIEFYNNAIRCLKKVLELNENLSTGWCLLGQTQYYLGIYDEANVSLTKAIDLDPTGEGGKMASESLALMKQTLG